MARLSDSGRAAKGKRPEPHAAPAVDRLISMIVALTGEVAALRQRVDAIESVAERNRAFSRGEIEDFVPDGADAARQAGLRRALLENVFYLVTKELRDIQEDASPEQYHAIVKAISVDL